MEAINFIFIFFIIVGFVITIYALVQAQKNQNNVTDISTIDEGVNKLKLQVEEADRAIDELNSIAEQVFLEFQEKKKELMFLYDLIEQKEKEFSGNVDISVGQETDDAIKSKDEVKKVIKKYENPLLEQILEMQSKGMSVSEIAKSMKVGKGEIEIILNLWKEYSYE